MFSMSHYTDWQQGRVNRNYHVLQELQKDPRVDKIISVDFLPFSWKKVAKVYLENVIWPMKDLELIYGDLTSACHQVNNKLYIYSTIDSIYSQTRVIKELRKIVKILEMDNIVFWSYNPLFTVSLKELGRKLLGHETFVFDAVDNWLEHSAFTKRQADLRVGYQIVRQDADLIFTVSDHLKDKLFSENKRSHWIPNGIDMDHFAGFSGSKEVPEEMKDLPRPIIGYHGIIQGRIDLDLIKYVAKKNPDKSIVLLGSTVWRSYRQVLIKELGSYKNVHLLPFVSYQDLPQYLYNFDVAMIPHKVNELTKSMNPLKLYEYSACGRPVVTTCVEGIETFKNILYLADTYEEFNNKIQLALRENNKELEQTRMEVVADDGWNGRVQLMLKYLFDSLEK